MNLVNFDIFNRLAAERKQAGDSHMFNSNKLAALVAVQAVLLTMIGATPALASAPASDSACDAAYNSGPDLANGANGGSGFGPWALTPTPDNGNAGFFVGNSGNNGGGGGPGINCAPNTRAWGIYAHNNNTAEAKRPFTSGAMINLQSFSIDIDSGYDNAPESGGFGLQNTANNNNRFEFFHAAGQANYQINDNTANFDTGIPFSDGGIRVVFTLTAANTYSVSITRLATSATTTFTGRTLGGTTGSGIDRLRVFRFSNRGDDTGANDWYFNNISLSCNAGPSTVISPAGPLTVCAGAATAFSNTGNNSGSRNWSLTANTAGASFVGANNNVSSVSVQTTQAGSYTLNLANSLSGCSQNAVVNVTVQASPTCSVTASPGTTVCSGTTVTLSATVTGGVGPFTYAWTGPGIVGSATGSSISAVPTAPSSLYQVTVTDGGQGSGCNSTFCQQSIIVNVVSTTAGATPNPICVGQTLNLTATGGAGDTYAWTGPSFASSLQNPSIANVTLSAAGVYSVTRTSGGCVSAPSTVNVVVNDVPACSITGPSSACPKMSSTFTGPAGMSTYAWSVSAGATISGPANGSSATVLSDTSYTVTLTVVNAAGCSSTCSQPVNVDATAPSIGTQPVDTTACSGNSVNLTASATDASGVSYHWRKRGSGWGASGWTTVAGGGGLFVASSTINNFGGPTSNGGSDINTGAGRAWGLFNHGGATTEALRPFNASLAVGDTFTIDMDNGNLNGGATVGFGLQNIANNNDRFEVFFVGGDADYTVSDSTGSHDSLVGFTRTGIRVSFTLTSVDTYSVTIIRFVGTSFAQTNTLTGTLKGTAGTSIDRLRLFYANGGGYAGSDNDVFFNSVSFDCRDDNAANSPYNDGFDTGDNGGQAPLANGGNISGADTATLTFNPAATSDTASYDVCVEDPCHNHTISSAATLTVNQTPDATISGSSSVCDNDTGNASVPNAGGGATYVWSVSQGSISSGQGTPSISYTPGPAGTLTISVAITGSGSCNANGTKNVTVNASPSATISAPAAVCANSSGNTASIPSAGAGATYSWIAGNGSITSGQGTESITFSAGANSPVNLQVSVTDANGCSKNGATSVSVTPSPVCSITGPVNACPLSTSTFIAPGGMATYAWSVTGSATINGAADGQSVTVDAGASGSYTVTLTVTDAGCSSTCSQTVAIDSIPPTITCSAPALLNAGFELGGPDGSQIISDWSIFGNGYHQTFSPHSGSFIAKTFGNWLGNPDYTGVFQDLPAAAGQTWRASVYAMLPSGDLVQNGSYGKLNIEFYNGGTFISAQESQHLTVSSPHDTYINLSITAIAPAGTTKVRIVPTFVQLGFGGGAVYFDDASLTRITTVSVDGSCQAAIPDVTSLATASDNVSGVTLGQSPAAGTIVGIGNHTVTVTATDDCGNQSQCSHVVSVVDDTAPALTCPANATIECDASSDPANTGSATALDGCPGPIAISYSDTTAAGACGQASTITRTWSARDAAGNLAECVQTITRQDSTAPVLAGVPANTTVQCAANIPAAPSAARAWGLYANSGALSEALRPFASPLAVGQTFIIDYDSGFIDVGGTVGFGLRNALGENRFELFFAGGDSFYRVKGNGPSVVTAIGYTGEGLHVEVTLTGADSFSVKIVRLQSGTSQTLTGTLGGTAGSAIELVRFFNATAGGGSAKDAFFNSLSIPGVAFDNASAAAYDDGWLSGDNGGTGFGAWTVQGSGGNDPANFGRFIGSSTANDGGDSNGDGDINSLNVTASDNCDPHVNVSYSQTDNGASGCAGSPRIIVRTWAATDDCGNTVSQNQVITQEDTQAPTLSGVPADANVQCSGDVPPPANVTAADNCDASATVQYSATTNGNQITRTWSSADVCGNAASASQVITIQDTIAPAITCPANAAISCSDSSDPANTGFATATDNCDSTPTIAHSDVVTAGACPQARTITRTWSATDDAGNSNQCVQVISVADTTAPVLAVPANVAIECTADSSPAGTGQASATDNCDDSSVIAGNVWINEIHYDNTGTDTNEFIEIAGPAGTVLTGSQLVLYNGANGLVYNTKTLSGVIDDEGCGYGAIAISYPVNGIQNDTDGLAVALVVAPGGVQFLSYEGVFVAADGPVAGMASTDVGVNETGTTPIGRSLQLTGSGNAYSSFAWNPPFAASPGSLNVGQTITPCLAGGVTLISHSDVVTPGSCPQNKTITRTWTAQDSCGNSASAAQTITVADTTAPVVTCATPASLVNASFETGNGPGGLVIAGWSSFGPSPNTPNVFHENFIPHSGAFHAKVFGSSSSGQTFSGLFQDLPAQAGQTWRASMWALTPANDNMQDGNEARVRLEFLNASFGLISAVESPALGNGGPANVHVQLAATGTAPAGTAYARIVGSFEQNGPAGGSVFFDDASLSMLTVSANANCEGTVPDLTSLTTASDACDATVAITQSPAAGTLVGLGSHTVTFTAADDCNNAGSCSVTLDVVDDTIPSLACPATVLANSSFEVGNGPGGNVIQNWTRFGGPTPNVLHENAIPRTDAFHLKVWGQFTGSDNYSGAYQELPAVPGEAWFAQAYVLLPSSDHIVGANRVRVVLEFLDSSFILLSQVQSISLTLVNATDVYVPLTAHGVAPAGTAYARLVCQFQQEDGFASGSAYFDDATLTKLIVPADATCQAQIPDFAASALAVDNCDSTLTVVQTPAAGTTVGAGVNFVVIQTTDDAGNTAECGVPVAVLDQTPPAITCPASVSVECGDSTQPEDTGFATATDNCDAVPVVRYVDNVVTGACPNEKVITRTWIASDLANNQATCVQTITVEDQTPPAFADVPADATVACNAVPSPAVVTAGDGCFDPVSSNNLILYYSFDANSPSLVTDDSGSGNTGTIVGAVNWIANGAIGGAYDFAGGYIDVGDLPASEGTYGLTFGAWINPDSVGLYGVLGKTLGLDESYYLIVNTISTINGFVEPENRNEARGNPTFPNAIQTGTWQYVICVYDGQTFTAYRNGQFYSSETYPTVQPVRSNNVRLAIGDVAVGRGWRWDGKIDELVVYNRALSADEVTRLYAERAGLPVPVQYSESTAGSCPTIRTRVWTAADICGNSASVTQVLTVVDTVAPVLNGVPASTTVQCDAIPAAATVTASDACDPSVSVAMVETQDAGSCPGQFTITRTWTATDDCGNNSVASQVITVIDTTAPVLSGQGADATIECPATPSFTAPTATDNCDAAPSIAFADSTVPGACAGAYTVTRTWTATDNCGNDSVPVSQTITVVDTTAPTLVGVPDDTVAECEEVPLAATVTATDNCDASPVIGFVENVSSGTCATGYTMTRTWTATDACGNSTSITQTITVSDTTAPIVTATISSANVLANPSFDEGTAHGTTVMPGWTNFGNGYQEAFQPRTGTNHAKAFGNFGTNENFSGWYQDYPASAGQVWRASVYVMHPSADAWSPGNEAKVRIEYFDATNGFLTAADSYHLKSTTAQDTYILLSVTLAAPAGTAYVRIVPTYMQLNIVSPNGAAYYDDASLELVESSLDVQCAADVPAPDAGLVVAQDNCDRFPVVSFVGDANNGGAGCAADPLIITRTFRGTDACGNFSDVSVTINVADTIAPILVGVPADATAECDSIPAAATVTATDNCDTNATVTFSESTSTGSCASGYSITRTWTATDDCGNSFSASQTITVEDTTDPTLVGVPADATVQCDAIPAAATVTATDNCDSDVAVAFNESQASGSCPGQYTITRTWTATDDCGNDAVASQIITVQDTTAPTLSGQGADATIECPASPSFTAPTASDNCDAAPSIAFNDVTTPGTCAGAYSVTRTWIATDNCDNESEPVSQTITVVDTTDPVLAGIPADATVECDAIPAAATVTATDNCATNVAVAFSESTITGSCANGYTIVRTWTATDDCGNDVTASQTITVQDTTAPTLSGQGADATIECPASPSFTAPTASDNCDAAPSIAFTDSTVTGSCAGAYTVTRTWTATDNCGNESEPVSQTITVVDTSAPALVGVPADVTVECNAVPAAASITATDGCDSDVAVAMTEATTPGSCPGSYTIARTWTATDDCGNSSSDSQTITVQDTTAPVLSGQGADATIECPASPSFTAPTASDNCDAAPSISFTDSTVPGSCAGAYTVTRTWTATDNCGNESAPVSQTITVVDTTDPTVVAPADVMIECGDSTAPANTGSATASDSCDGSPVVTYSDSASSATCPKVITRTWTATDACGNSDSAIQVITVADTFAPTLSSVPANATILCSDPLPAPASVNATDTCTTATLTYTQVVQSATCPKVYVRTWTAVDNCGNTVAATQTITAVDTTAPTIACVSNVTVQCGAGSTDPSATGTPSASDNCATSVTVTFADTVIPGPSNPPSCALSIQQGVQNGFCFSYLSQAGSSATYKDGKAFYTSGSSSKKVAGSGGTLSGTPAGSAITVSGTVPVESSANITLSGTLNFAITNGGLIGTLNYTWGSETGTFYFYKYTFGGGPANGLIGDKVRLFGNNWNNKTMTKQQFINAGGTPRLLNLGALLDIHPGSSGSCGSSVVRTWTAADSCGNSATCTQVITVVDTQAPVLSGCPIDQVIRPCDAVPPPPTITAADACNGSLPVTYVQTVVTNFDDSGEDEWGHCGDDEISNVLIIRTWTATDNCGNSVNCTQVITVDHRGNCVLSAGYWKNHPSDWPVTSLRIGCTNNILNQAQLLAILNNSSCGNAPVILARQLIAALLNLELGACPSAEVTACVANAQSLLCAYPVNSNPPSSIRNQMTSAADCLDRFNNGQKGNHKCDSNDLNHPPVAMDDTATTYRNTAVTIPVLSNDTDSDGDDLDVLTLTDPASGEVDVNSNGTVTYTPATNFVGADSFTYIIADGEGGFASAVVMVFVQPPAPQPPGGACTEDIQSCVARSTVFFSNSGASQYATFEGAVTFSEGDLAPDFRTGSSATGTLKVTFGTTNWVAFNTGIKYTVSDTNATDNQETWQYGSAPTQKVTFLWKESQAYDANRDGDLPSNVGKLFTKFIHTDETRFRFEWKSSTRKPLIIAVDGIVLLTRSSSGAVSSTLPYSTGSSWIEVVFPDRLVPGNTIAWYADSNAGDGLQNLVYSHVASADHNSSDTYFNAGGQFFMSVPVNGLSYNASSSMRKAKVEFQIGKQSVTLVGCSSFNVPSYSANCNNWSYNDD